MKETECNNQVQRPTFVWMVEWSAGLITRYVKVQTDRTAYREAHGHDAQAPVGELEENYHVHVVKEAVSSQKILHQT